MINQKNQYFLPAVLSGIVLPMFQSHLSSSFLQIENQKILYVTLSVTIDGYTRIWFIHVASIPEEREPTS